MKYPFKQCLWELELIPELTGKYLTTVVKILLHKVSKLRETTHRGYHCNTAQYCVRPDVTQQRQEDLPYILRSCLGQS